MTTASQLYNKISKYDNLVSYEVLNKAYCLSKKAHTEYLGPGSDSEAHVLPLLGRRTYNRSNKWVYYTATDKYNQVRIPISHNGRNCGGEYGCDEIMDGDTITIPELNGTFVAKIYENTSLHYIPY